MFISVVDKKGRAILLNKDTIEYIEDDGRDIVVYFIGGMGANITLTRSEGKQLVDLLGE